MEFTRNQCWSVHAWRLGAKAADVYCVEERPVLKVNDLFVQEVMLLPETRWGWIRRRLAGRPAPTCRNRGRGLGSALLDFIAKQAKAAGFSHLKGEVYAKDFAANPNLPDWYRQRGFTVDLLPPEAHRIAVCIREL